MTTTLFGRVRRVVSAPARAYRRIISGDPDISNADLDRDVIITGYYGAGNFGDDLISNYVLRLACDAIPAARIAVDAPSNSYLERWFPGIKCVPLEKFSKHPSMTRRKVVFGGGGLFHAFPPATAANLWGLEKATIYQYWRRFGGKNWAHSRKYAFCVGVGPLEGKGAQWITGELLADFERISVRDEYSTKFLSNLGVKNTVAGADPSVALIDLLPSGIEHGRQTLGIIVRGWIHPPSIDGFITSLHAAAQLLRAAGWQVQFISFQSGNYEPAQHQVTRFLQDKREVIREWDPNEEDILSFCQYMRNFSTVLTMRAHGIFLSAILGAVPIAVLVEPKLMITASVCGFADQTISINSDSEEIVAAVNRANGKCPSRNWHSDLRLLQDESSRLCQWLRSI